MPADAKSSGDFLGLAVEWWQVIASFVAPILGGIILALIGVWLGGTRLRRELQGQDARHQFLDDGLIKLSDAFEQMLGAIRLNYAVCLYLLRLQRDFDRNHPAAPRSDDLPMLQAVITDPTAFAAIGPASRIADSRSLGELATQTFAALFNINLWFLTEIWLPVRGYYSHDESDRSLNRNDAFDQLTERATSKYHEAEAFAPVSRLLRDLALRTMEIGLNSFDDFWRVRKDKEIIRLRDELNTILDELTREPTVSTG